MALCLGCNAIMVRSTVGDYCHACRDEIKAVTELEERQKPNPPKSTTLIDTQHWRPTGRDRMPYLSFGKRKPRLYTRPK